MVTVPKGPFLYGEGGIHEAIVHDYWFDQYPVTNEKYCAFISADGYGNQVYWSEEGWKWRTRDNITCPKYWNDTQWNKADHPVVGVSYYDAEAYAKWVGKRLPTEREWEKAARARTGASIPGETSSTRASVTAERQRLVTRLRSPKGGSPYGCYDMAGNVWEWCANWFDEEKKDWRVVRGGSWSNLPKNLRVSNRFRTYANRRSNDIGFRLALDIP